VFIAVMILDVAGDDAVDSPVLRYPPAYYPNETRRVFRRSVWRQYLPV